MKIEICDELRGDIELLTTVPESMLPRLRPGAHCVTLQGDAFLAMLQEFRGSGFSAWYTEYWTTAPAIIRARGDLPVLELRIACENQLEGTWDKIVQPSLPMHTFNLSFTPHVATRAIFAENQEVATFDIHFDIPFLAALGIDYATLDRFLQQVQMDQPAELAERPVPCPIEMIAAVRAILRNSYSPIAQPYLVEYKVKEILLIALESIGRSTTLLPMKLHPRDIDALHQVKSIITQHCPKWVSPELLCRETGLNELKLKVGFKHVFGITPYDFHIQLKMQEAQRLLKEGQESIVSIAYLCGYDHPSSFSREFKKAFGYTPGYFKKHGR